MEAACPLRKSNYDNHGSGKGCSQKSRNDLFYPAGCLFESQLRPVQKPLWFNVVGPSQGV